MAKKSGFSSSVDISMLVKSALALALLAFLVYCAKVRLDSQLNEVKISVEKIEDQKPLIGSKQVRNRLKEHLGYDITLANARQIDLFELEKELEKDSRINTAEIYLDKNNNLHVNVKQKRPIVRIEVTGGEDYYLDYTGDKIPITESVRVPVVTGKINSYKDNYRTIKKHNLNDVLQVARKVYDNEFLTSLVDQIDVDQNNEIVLVPKLGKGKIQLGQITDLDEKIYKLKVYYANGLKNIGIDKFDELDLRYRNQVIPRNLQS